MKRIQVVTVFSVVAALFSLGLIAGVSNVMAQEKCPVMSLKIDANVYADHEGKRVFFCCKGCIGNFKKDPARYLKKMEN